MKFGRINVCGQFDARKTVAEWLTFIDECDDLTAVLLVGTALLDGKLIKMEDSGSVRVTMPNEEVLRIIVKRMLEIQPDLYTLLDLMEDKDEMIKSEFIKEILERANRDELIDLKFYLNAHKDYLYAAAIFQYLGEIQLAIDAIDGVEQDQSEANERYKGIFDDE